MSWLMFLDDERFPESSIEDDAYRADVGLPPVDPALRLISRQWVIARSVEEALELIRQKGMPSFIAFDHDLGHDVFTGAYLADKLVEMDLEGEASFPVGFSYEVHSNNYWGRVNIRSKLDSYLRFKRKQGGTPTP